MDNDQLLAHLKRLRDKIRENDSILGTHSEVCEFLRVYFGPKNSFLEAIRKLDTRLNEEYLAKHLGSNLDSLINRVREVRIGAGRIAREESPA